MPIALVSGKSSRQRTSNLLQREFESDILQCASWLTLGYVLNDAWMRLAS